MLKRLCSRKPNLIYSKLIKSFNDEVPPSNVKIMRGPIKPQQYSTPFKEDKTQSMTKQPPFLKSNDPNIQTNREQISLSDLIPEVDQHANEITQNSVFLKYSRNLSLFYDKVSRNAYIKTLKTLIEERIQMIQSDLARESSVQDFKVQNLKLGNEPTESQTIQSHPIFKTNSINKVEASLAELPKETLNNINFKYSLLNFYGERNIDKAFEYYYNNLRNESEVIVEDFLPFLKNCFKYDKVHYLLELIHFVTEKNIVINVNPESFMGNFISYHGKTNFNPENSLLALRYLLHISKNKELTIKTKENLNEILERVVKEKFDSREPGSDLFLTVIEEVFNRGDKIFFMKGNNQQVHSLKFSEPSLARILTLLFDQKDEKLAQIIYDLIDKNSESLPTISRNLIAYHNYFGISPRIFNVSSIKSAYFKYRRDVEVSKSNRLLTDNQVETFLILFKINGMDEYVADILNKWKELTRNSTKSSTQLFYLSSYILNSKLNTGDYYHKVIDTVYSNVNNSIEYKIQKTLAYLKDGNKKHAIDYFNKAVESNINEAKSNDSHLLELYRKVYEPKTNIDVNPKENKNQTANFDYILEKVNLVESIRRNAKKLIDFHRDSTGSSYLDEKAIDDLSQKFSTSNNDNQYERSLIQTISRDISRLSVLKLDSFPNATPDTLTDLEEVIAKIKVHLYLNKEFYFFASQILEREIIFLEEIIHLEFDLNQKEKYLNNANRIMKTQKLSKEEKDFIQLMINYIQNKPIDIKRTVRIEEAVMSKIEDDRFSNEMKIPKNMVPNTVSTMSKLKERYFHTKKHPYVKDNLTFLQEKLQSDIKQSKKENLPQSLEEFNKLYGMTSKVLPYTSSIHLSMGRNLTNVLRKQIINKNAVDNVNKATRELLKLTRGLYYYRMVVCNRLPLREKNIIKAIYNKTNKNDLGAYVVNFKFPSFNVEANPLTNLLLNLENLITKQRNETEDNIIMERVLEKVCAKLHKGSWSKLSSHMQQQNSPMTEKEKLGQIKDLLNQNYKVINENHAIHMIIYGIQNNLAEAIRLAEKVCSDQGYVLPSWLEAMVNKYLIKHPQDYEAAAKIIRPVNVASVYKSHVKPSEDRENYGIESKYDHYKSPSIYAIDHLPFKGLEELVDMQKFHSLMKQIGTKHDLKFL